ncbi:MAG: hypothetical protein HRT45_13485 [Bdellovibrionales bacterium]|nr:hypothetical protein [Bdellovibrionales bacterium]
MILIQTRLHRLPGSIDDTVFDEDLRLLRDKNNLYLDTHKTVFQLSNFDPETFKKFNDDNVKIRNYLGYYKDKDRVYFLSSWPKYAFLVVETTEPEKFELHPKRDKRPGDATDDKCYFKEGIRVDQFQEDPKQEN